MTETPQTFSDKPASRAAEQRDWGQAMRRGTFGKCPACGEGQLFRKYLKVADSCPKCGEELHHHRADDAPPYFTMMIVCHFIVAGIMAVEEHFQPSYWLHIALWFPLTIGMCMWMLPHIKGSLVGLQWALRMHGFDGHDPLEPSLGEPANASNPKATL
ncbi:DUF983 domain-containing protein [Hyphomicrobium sp. D-2]|uniref:DUF983 domain-containing protein n=1 Tax=Hyphomicrobium sp. D-2 TaxID=3041621 RepID=UPI002456E3FE|nr:DUF983 domain-containing protein [Hyphomicrobium sp. D-2]MDH4982733.1 DUF983 domain-containing protein [Hyphomicrobium sp. D-2]